MLGENKGEAIMKEEKKLGLPSALAAGIGLIVATSVLVSLSQGIGIGGRGFIIAMAIACGLNILVALSFAEMNSLMPISGGLGQYTMAAMGPFVAMIAVIGGYLFTNIFAASSEAAMIGNENTDLESESNAGQVEKKLA